LLNTAIDTPSALVVEGEAGIGKTTVWLEGLQRARQRGFTVLSARAANAQSVLAYAALADLLEGVSGSEWADLPGVGRARSRRTRRSGTR
jgi:hypothetical protein